MAILGSAAGTTARAYGHYFPRTAIDAVEIDRALIDVGRKLFDMRAPRLRTHAEDARPWLDAPSARFDAIFVDAYRQPYIPFYLATREFFDLVRDRLTPGGVVVDQRRPPRGLGPPDAGARDHDGRRLHHGPARPGGADQLAAGGDRRAAPGPSACAPRLAACRPTCARSPSSPRRRLRPARRGGRVYTDDRAPVEWLIDSSIVQYAARGGN